MAANKSTNKVRVTALLGTEGVLGLMDPAIDMKVRHGIDDRWIVSLTSGNYLANLALSSGGAVKGQAYPHELLIPSSQAAYFGWSTGGGSVKFGHKGIFPNGVPVIEGTGVTYLGGDGVEHTYGRA